MVEQRLLGDEEHRRHDDPGAEREQLEPPQKHYCGDETDGHEHPCRRSPVERVQEHALDVVRNGRAEAARVPVVGDDGLP